MPHGGPHQKTTTFKKQKTDARPPGMPSFLSYKAPPKKDSWKTLSTQQLTERFNKNQQSYKEDFLKKHPKPLTSTYGYGIPEYDDPKEDKIQREIRNRKSYRWAQDPKVIKANKKELEKKLAFERQQDLGYFSRVSETKDYFDSLAIKAKSEFIQPNAGWFEKTLKSNAIDAWFSTGNTIVGTFEGALGLTLDPAANFVATTIANGNELYNNILGMDVSPEDKDELIREIQEHLIGSTMAYWESNAYGGMRIHRAPLKHPELTWTQTAKFVKAKIPFTWNNSIKTLKTMKENIKAKNMAKNMTVEGDWSIVAEAAMKEPAVKTEIKQLTIQSLEHSLAQKVGNIGANNIANHLRVKNNIMPVAPLAVGAAVTPPELIEPKGIENSKTKSNYFRPPLNEGPFYNGLEVAVDGITADANGMVTLDQVKKVTGVKRFAKHTNVTGFNDEIARLDAQNISKLPKQQILQYLKENPFKLQGEIAATSKGPLADIASETELNISKMWRKISENNQRIHNNTQTEIIDRGYSQEYVDNIAVYNNNIFLSPEIIRFSTTNLLNKLSEGLAIDNTLDKNITLKDFTDGNWRLWHWTPNQPRGASKERLRGDMQIKIAQGLGFRYKSPTDVSVTGKKVKGYPAPSDVSYYEKIPVMQSGGELSISGRLEGAQLWLKEFLQNMKKQEIQMGDSKGIISVGGGEILTPVPTYEELATMLFEQQNNPSKEVRHLNGLKFKNITNALLTNAQANSLPEWKYYSDALTSYSGADTTHSRLEVDRLNFESLAEQVEISNKNLTNLKNSQEYKDEQTSVIPGGDAVGYTVKGLPRWEGQGTYVYSSGEMGTTKWGLKKPQYFELMGRTNQLTNFPKYRDPHFGKRVGMEDIVNLAFWQLANRRDGTNMYEGRTIMWVEEIQPTDPLYGQDNLEFVGESEGPIPGAHLTSTGSPFYGKLTQRPLFEVETLPDGTKILKSKYSQKATTFNVSPNAAYPEGMGTKTNWVREKPVNLIRFEENPDGSIKVLEEYDGFKEMAVDTDVSYGDRAVEGYVEEGPDAIPSYNISSKFASYDDFLEETTMAIEIPNEVLQREMGAGSATGGQANWLKKDLWMGITNAYNSGDAVYAWPTTATMLNKKVGQRFTGGVYDNSAKILESLGFKVERMPLWDLGIMPPKDEFPNNVHPTESGGWELEVDADVKQWYIDRYGDHEGWGVDLDAPQLDGKDIFEILNTPMDVGALNIDQQTNQLLSTFV